MEKLKETVMKIPAGYYITLLRNNGLICKMENIADGVPKVLHIKHKKETLYSIPMTVERIQEAIFELIDKGLFTAIIL